MSSAETVIPANRGPQARRPSRDPAPHSEFGAWRAELTGARLTDGGLRWQPGKGVRRITPGQLVAVALFAGAAVLVALTLLR